MLWEVYPLVEERSDEEVETESKKLLILVYMLFSMSKDNFEKKYMEKSWKMSKSKAYRTFDIDKSVMDFTNFLKIKKVKGTLLDLGCGNGRNSVFFEKKGFNVLGIDFAQSAVKVCKKFAESKNSNANFVSGDILKYPFKKNYFDVVIDAGCLHHIRKQYWQKYKNNLLKSKMIILVNQNYLLPDFNKVLRKMLT